MKLLCKLFGHRPHQGTITSSFYFKLKNGEWERVANTGPAVFCLRCGKHLSEAAAINIMHDTAEPDMHITGVATKREDA